MPNTSAHPKDAINDHVRRRARRSDATQGTKCAAHHVLEIAAGGSAHGPGPADRRGPRGGRSARAPTSTATFATRREEADAFYATVIPPALDADRALVMRQALAGLLWSKQYYEYDVHRWLREHGVNPWAPGARGRCATPPWFHMVAGDIISMPDKWEYPWFAAWDLAFHCAPLSLVDVDFAKEQVELLLRTRYMHPNGADPGLRVELLATSTRPCSRGRRCTSTSARSRSAAAATASSSQRVFQRLLTNFSWWVNRKDPDGRNLFQGGFLGLDNIGIFDRSAPLPGGGTLEQADGTAWMALYCQWMLQMAVELAREDPAYVDMALKFVVALRVDRDRAQPAGRRHAAVGRAGRLLLRRDAHARRHHVPAQGALARRAAAAVRGDRLRRATSIDRHPVLIERALAFVEHFSDDVPSLAHLPGPGAGRAAPARARRRDAAAADPRGHARRGRVPRAARHPLDLAAPPRRAVPVRLGRRSTTRSATCPPSPTPACSAATRTGAGRSGSR